MLHRAVAICLLTVSLALLAQSKKTAKTAAKKADGPTAVSGKPITLSLIHI